MSSRHHLFVLLDAQADRSSEVLHQYLRLLYLGGVNLGSDHRTERHLLTRTEAHDADEICPGFSFLSTSRSLAYSNRSCFTQPCACVCVVLSASFSQQPGTAAPEPRIRTFGPSSCETPSANAVLPVPGAPANSSALPAIFLPFINSTTIPAAWFVAIPKEKVRQQEESYQEDPGIRACNSTMEDKMVIVSDVSRWDIHRTCQKQRKRSRVCRINYSFSSEFSDLQPLS